MNNNFGGNVSSSVLSHQPVVTHWDWVKTSGEAGYSISSHCRFVFSISWRSRYLLWMGTGCQPTQIDASLLDFIGEAPRGCFKQHVESRPASRRLEVGVGKEHAAATASCFAQTISITQTDSEKAVYFLRTDNLKKCSWSHRWFCHGLFSTEEFSLSFSC